MVQNQTAGSDNDLVAIYQNSPGSTEAQAALQTIIERHGALIFKLAQQASQNHPNVAELNDFLQEAHVACAAAMSSFDFERQVKFTSHLWNRIYFSLLDYANLTAMISCPPNLRSMRSYLSGVYDCNPEKKAKFEQQNSLFCDESRAEAAKKYATLNPIYLSVDRVHTRLDYDFGFGDYVPSALCEECPEDEIIRNIEFEQAMKKLTSEQRRIIQYRFIDDMSIEEAASLLEMQPSSLRSKIKNIQRTFAGLL